MKITLGRSAGAIRSTAWSGQAIGRRSALAATLATSLAASGWARAQQPWPARPITLIVGYPPGGQTDFASRVIQPGLSTALGQPLVIENRTGANGNIATDLAIRARPDGYTLLAGNVNQLAINPHTLPNMTIDPLQFVPIGLMLQSTSILCVHPSVPAQNVSELAAWAKSQDAHGGFNYGSSGAGGATHAAMALFINSIGNPRAEHIPYRGAGPAVQDFIAGRFSVMIDAASVLTPFLRSNQVRGILVTSKNRIPAFPDIPTAEEQGLPDFIFSAWIGLFGPPNLPAEIVMKASDALRQSLQNPAARERIIAAGEEPGDGTPVQLGEMMRRDHARWGGVIRANNIRVEF